MQQTKLIVLDNNNYIVPVVEDIMMLGHGNECLSETSFLLTSIPTDEVSDFLHKQCNKYANFRIYLLSQCFYNTSSIVARLVKKGIPKFKISVVNLADFSKGEIVRTSSNYKPFILNIFLLIISPFLFLKIFVIDILQRWKLANNRVIDLINFILYIGHECFVSLQMFYNKVLVRYSSYIYWKVIYRYIVGDIFKVFIYGTIWRRFVYDKVLVRYSGYIYWKVIYRYIVGDFFKVFIYGTIWRRFVYDKVLVRHSSYIYWKVIYRYIVGDFFKIFIYGTVWCRFIYGTIWRRLIFGRSIQASTSIYYFFHNIYGHRNYIIHKTYFVIYILFKKLSFPLFKVYWFIRYQYRKRWLKDYSSENQ